MSVEAAASMSQRRASMRNIPSTETTHDTAGAPRAGAALVVAFLLALSPRIARADGPAGDIYGVDSKMSSIAYVLVHKLHTIHGVSKKVEGKARVAPTGQATVQVRVPVESFDSENVNRDEHMKETVEAAKFPSVELK